MEIDVSYWPDSIPSPDWLPEYVRGRGTFDVLSRIGSRIVSDVEAIISLGGFYSIISFLAVFTAIWVMQVSTRGATMATRPGRLLWAKRTMLGVVAAGMALNTLTPFIIPDPPWLSEIPVVIGISLVLLLHGLEFKFNYIRFNADE